MPGKAPPALFWARGVSVGRRGPRVAARRRIGSVRLKRAEANTLAPSSPLEPRERRGWLSEASHTHLTMPVIARPGVHPEVRDRPPSRRGNV